MIGMAAEGATIGDKFKMIRDAGFVRTKVEPILGGLVAIHSGWKVACAPHHPSRHPHLAPAQMGPHPRTPWRAAWD